MFLRIKKEKLPAFPIPHDTWLFCEYKKDSTSESTGRLALRGIKICSLKDFFI